VSICLTFSFVTQIKLLFYVLSSFTFRFSQHLGTMTIHTTMFSHLVVNLALYYKPTANCAAYNPIVTGRRMFQASHQIHRQLTVPDQWRRYCHFSLLGDLITIAVINILSNHSASRLAVATKASSMARSLKLRHVDIS